MDELGNVKDLFQNLSDINRLKILFFIGNKERSVSEVVNNLGISQPLVSHHLKKLRQCGILSTRRKGPFVNYCLANRKILEIIKEFNNINISQEL